MQKKGGTIVVLTAVFKINNIFSPWYLLYVYPTGSAFIYLLTSLLIGVPRETEKEKELADFDIFDDPESPFSTFNFQYPNEAFTRLHDLMEFNTLNNLEVSSFFTGYLLAPSNIKQ